MNSLREEHVRAIGRGGAQPRNSQTSRISGQTAEKRPCNRCGKSNHQTSECTFPRSVKCVKCCKLGHIGPACRGDKPPGQANSLPNIDVRVKLLPLCKMMQYLPALKKPHRLCQLLAKQTQPSRTESAALLLLFTYDYRRWAGQPRACRLRRIQLRPCCLLYTSPSPRDRQKSRMPSSD